jgi:hypothetical protein
MYVTDDIELSRNKLSVAQLNAIDCIVTGKSITQAAESLNVSRRTVSRWVNCNPYFIVVLNAKRREIWSGAHERLRGMVDKALDVMEVALDGGDAKVAVDVLKAVNIYGSVSAPHGSTNADEITAGMAERYARELLLSAPSQDPVAQAMYAQQMLPIITTEIYQDIKENIDKIISGEDEDGQ